MGGVNKISSLVTTTSAFKMAGYNIENNNPAASYNRFYLVNGYNIGFTCNSAMVGMALNDRNYVYCISDTSSTATFKTSIAPISVSQGHLDSTGNWVIDGLKTAVNNGDGTYSIEYNSQECVRIEFAV
jgi:hypothetical protein